MQVVDLVRQRGFLPDQEQSSSSPWKNNDRCEEKKPRFPLLSATHLRLILDWPLKSL